ncbi:MAG: Asp-tRNA(Asn)/Glu-tRNA(Gln) amidotransferase subunit GatC [bacterium]
MSKKDKTESSVDAISDQLLQDVIRLARLDPSDPSMELKKEHLKKILDYFGILSGVDVEGVDPTVQINAIPVPLRADGVKESLSREDALGNSVLKVGEFFRSPQILGGEETEHS